MIIIMVIIRMLMCVGACVCVHVYTLRIVCMDKKAHMV